MSQSSNRSELNYWFFKTKNNN